MIVSVVHVYKGALPGPYSLDGRRVELITAYLFHAGGHNDPAKLEENENKSFIGSYVLGMGFTFDDTDREGVASSLSEMHRLIEENPKNAGRIFPYLGGEEVNKNPTHAHHRYVINFEDFPLRRKELGHSWFGLTEETQRAQLREGIVAPDYPAPVAADWPDLLKIVEERVKPERMAQNDDYGQRHWWRFLRTRPELHAASAQLGEVLACSRIGNAFAFAFLPKGTVCNEKTVLFTLDRRELFGVLQSRIHEVWTRFFSSTLKDDLQYTPSNCFETFPFPEDYETNSTLEEAGRTYYDFRADLMVRNNEGLTKTYNRFHNPNEQSHNVKKLRELHDAMDRAVLDAYGWSNIRPVCEFFSEFEEDEDAEEPESGRTGIKKYPYRWPDQIHDEVLALLLALNQERAAIPQIEVEPSASTETHARRPKKSKKTDESNPSLFEPQLT